ncbi:MAG: hypothetical protein M0Z28_28020, partial [Rhodospirillales bacterium]|nr:hypothetical protein [Rhodospirillales bacterium]
MSSTSTLTFANSTAAFLDFTNISLVETDSGPGTQAFIGSSYSMGPFAFGATPQYWGMWWNSFHAGVVGGTGIASATQTLSFDFQANAGAGGSIFGLQSVLAGVVTSVNAGDTATLSAVETVKDVKGNVVGAATWNPTSGFTAQWFSQGYGTLDVNLAITSSISSPTGSTLGDKVEFSAIQTGVVAGSVTVDKQVSVDGVNWFDTGNGVLNDPQTFVGDKVYYRVVVTNNSTGGVSLTNAAVGDTNGPSPFTFGGQSSFSLAQGGSIVSDVTTATAVAGYQQDTATLSGSFAYGTHTAAASASDTADYTGNTAGISIDKQVSVDGGVTWTEVGPGFTAATTPAVNAGSPVEFRVLVTDTGTLAETGVSVTDSTGLNFGISGATLAAGQTITSSAVTVTAVAGAGIDTATATGTASVVNGSATITQLVRASDSAAYLGLTGGPISGASGLPSIAVDKQVSVNGSTWVDVGSGVLNDPQTFVGDNVYYRVLV